MLKKPLVFLSVIVPIFNSENTLGDCLQAIMAIETFEDKTLELIVADDGSTDSSLNIAQKYNAIIVTSQSNKGAAFARNLGAKVASGEYLLFVDSDVVLLSKDIIQYIVNGFNNYDICGISGCYDEGIRFNNFLSAYKHLYMCFNYFKAPKFSPIVSSAILIVPRKIYLERGGFNEAYTSVMAEDMDFSIKLFLKEKKPFLLELRIKGLHLKKYNLITLLKTDYLRTKGIAKMIKNVEAKKIYLKAMRRNIVPLTILPSIVTIIWAALFKYYYLLLGGVLLLCWVISTQKEFYDYFRKKGNIWFALLAVGFYFIEIYYVAVCSLYLQLFIKGNSENIAII